MSSHTRPSLVSNPGFPTSEETINYYYPSTVASSTQPRSSSRRKTVLFVSLGLVGVIMLGVGIMVGLIVFRNESDDCCTQPPPTALPPATSPVTVESCNFECNQSECADCLDAAATINDCDVLAQAMCACPCTECNVQEYCLEYSECILQECPAECSQQPFDLCALSLDDNGAACLACGLALDTDACNTDALCNEFNENCLDLCGKCVGPLQSHLACLSPDCSLGCLANATPTAPVCPEEENVVDICTSDLLRSDDCRACHENAFDQAPRSSCKLFRRSYCTTTMDECDALCGNCASVLQDWTECVFGWDVCDLYCEFFKKIARLEPVVAQVVSCTTEQQAYEACGDASKECNTCLTAALDGARRQGSCELFRNDYCPAHQECSQVCGSCLDLAQDWVDCTLGDACSLDCALPVAQCAVQEFNYQTCLQNTPDQCLTCINARLVEVVDFQDDCEAYVDGYCAEIEQCDDDCGECIGPITEWVDCFIGGLSCNVNCDG